MEKTQLNKNKLDQVLADPIYLEELHQLAAIKMLFLQYGVVHEVLARAFKWYLVGCDKNSVGGFIRITSDRQKLIVCNVYTNFFFSTKDMRKPSKKLAITKVNFSKLQRSTKKWAEYQSTVKNIRRNLNSWLKHWVWTDTKIIIYVDNELSIPELKKLDGQKVRKKSSKKG